jgi:S-adenosylmethionine:diacylglycerol 3-amino-3-carboxypropyl transferase
MPDRSNSWSLWMRAKIALEPVMDSPQIERALANVHEEFMYWRGRVDELKRTVMRKDMEMAKHLRATQRAKWRRDAKRKREKQACDTNTDVPQP